MGEWLSSVFLRTELSALCRFVGCCVLLQREVPASGISYFRVFHLKCEFKRNFINFKDIKMSKPLCYSVNKTLN